MLILTPPPVMLTPPTTRLVALMVPETSSATEGVTQLMPSLEPPPTPAAALVMSPKRLLPMFRP